VQLPLARPFVAPLLAKGICALLILFIAACSKSDPILEGERSPVFRPAYVEVTDVHDSDLGTPLIPEPCNFKIDSNNQIWHGNTRIFAGLPTESEIRSEKSPACRGRFVYAGLSTGELVKIDFKTRDLAWISDIFVENHPTANILFVDVIARPVINGDFIYVGGLGNAFCKIRDRDGSKIWCVPIPVRDIVKSTENYNLILSAEGKEYVVSADGRVYLRTPLASNKRWWWPF